MKLQIIIFSLLLSNFCFNQKNIHPCSAGKIKSHNLKSNTLSVAQIGKSEKYDVHFYMLDLAMDNLSTLISGTVEIHGHALVSLDSILFELFDSYNISDMRLNGIPCIYKRKQSCITIPANLNANDNFIVSISYSGIAPNASTNPLGGSGLTNDFSPSWNNQVTWTLSEPFSAYEWFPCKQSLTDKADSVQINVTVPSTCKAGSNGLLQEIIDLGAGKSKYVWKHNHAIDYYLISIAVAEYIDYSYFTTPANSPSPILIQNYIYNNPLTLPQFQIDLDETGSFINYFSDIFGLYPFYNEKYGHCMAPISGGMEHQTMTTQGNFYNTLTAHELAHQWWGDHVTCESWSDIFLNEGFASYAEYLMLAKMYSGDEVQDMFDRHINIMSVPNGSIWVEDSLDAGRIFDSRLTYDKGAAFIHTLRYLLEDDSMFFNALRNYQNTFAHSTANASDLKNELELISGLDLTKTFEEWYYGEGFPEYSVKWNLKNDSLLLILSQTTSAPLVTPFFTNPVDLLFKRSGISDTIIKFYPNSAISSFKIANLGNLSILSSVDPKNWIVNDVGSILRDFTLDQVTGLDNLISDFPIELFPNPVNEVLNINIGNDKSYLLKIIDAKGRTILEHEIHGNQKIDMSLYGNGMFLCQIGALDGGEVVRRIIKK